MISAANTVALVLAGGKSRRMQGLKKPDLLLAGEPLLLRVIERVKPQVSRVLVNLNEPVTNFDLPGYPIVPDVVSGYPGPLTGLVSAFDYLSEHDRHRTIRAVLLVPCDGPFLPANLADRLLAALNEKRADVACVRIDGNVQPTFSLWEIGTRDVARTMLFDRAEGGFKGLMRALTTVYVDWPAEEPDPFFNINTMDDLRLAERVLE